MMKKITRRSFLTVCGAVAAAAALSACGGSASSTAASSAAASSTAASSVAASAAGDLSGNVATGGSTSMKNVIAALTEGFAEVQPGVTVSYDPTGSGVVDLHIVQNGAERGVAAVVGPVGVDHLDLGDGGVPLLGAEILLAELDVAQIHGEALLVDELFQALFLQLVEALQHPRRWGRGTPS